MDYSAQILGITGLPPLPLLIANTRQQCLGHRPRPPLLGDSRSKAALDLAMSWAAVQAWTEVSGGEIEKMKRILRTNSVATAIAETLLGVDCEMFHVILDQSIVADRDAATWYALNYLKTFALRLVDIFYPIPTRPQPPLRNSNHTRIRADTPDRDYYDFVAAGFDSTYTSPIPLSSSTTHDQAALQRNTPISITLKSLGHQAFNFLVPDAICSFVLEPVPPKHRMLRALALLRTNRASGILGKQLGVTWDELHPAVQLVGDNAALQILALMSDLLMRKLATLLLHGSWVELVNWAHTELYRLIEWALVWQGPLPATPSPPLILHINFPTQIHPVASTNLPPVNPSIPDVTIAMSASPTSVPVSVSPPLPNEAVAVPPIDTPSSSSASTPPPSLPSVAVGMPHNDVESGAEKRKRERLSLDSDKTNDSIDAADIAESSTSAAARPSKATKKSKKRARNAASVAQNIIVEATEGGAGAGAGAEAEAEAEGVVDGVDDETAVQANESAASDVNAETGSAESAAAAAAAAAEQEA